MAPGGQLTHGFVDSPMGQLHYFEVGAGRPLLLLPQAGRSSRMYVGLAAALSADFRVVAVDIPGTGSSARLPAEGTTMAELAEAVATGLGGLGIDEVDALGLHGGNKVGAALAAGRPSLVGCFVFAGMSHSIVPDKATRDAMFLATPAVTDVLDAAREEKAWPDWDARMPDSVELAIDELEAFRDRPIFYRAAFEHDLEADLRRIEAPTLVLEIATPREDREVGRQGEALLATIPNATLLTLRHEDVDAVTLEDRPEEIAAISRRFLLDQKPNGK
jgi:pimeloyl-ACP methyl ester carboxylesterase